MLPRTRFVFAALLGLALAGGSLRADDLTSSLQKGTPDLQSAGPQRQRSLVSRVLSRL